MLNKDIKRKLDTARDILVGKIPDPKSQIEQITIALIYKFMDDMDKLSVAQDGVKTFFTGEYSKYSWDNLISPTKSGQETLELYSEAIEKMNIHPDIPQLFREIFKNAYLPYKDAQILKSFLKIIDWFKYDESEKLGDGFEYLLSVLGSQGSAGQFRTPRHIIDFIVSVVDPSKKDTVFDPACGTAGFLISAYKHILKTNNDENGSNLTPTEKGKINDNICGYDISPDMVRLSLVNLYLHGFMNPAIHEYDTLTSDERWDERFDVGLANPPFMSPKGGIRPHKRFRVSSKRSEVLFVDYISEHLNPGGKAGIIVPEGIIFRTEKAYKELRKMLLEDNLWCVVSLPAGVFKPYAGVKTSVLLMDKNLKDKTNEILFVKINNDGYSLGDQRNEIEENDLPQALELIKKYKKSLLKGEVIEIKETLGLTVKKEKIIENDYNLSGDRYIEEEIYTGNWERVELGDICEAEYGYSSSAKKEGEYRFIRITDVSDDGLLRNDDIKYTTLNEKSKKYILNDKDILVARTGATYGKVLCFEEKTKAIFAGYLIRLNFNKKRIFNKYFWVFSKSESYKNQKESLVQGGGQPQFNANTIKKIKIPLPPLEIQKKIVEEVEGYQKIIDGAKQVVENWKPTFKITPSWERVELENLCDFVRGPFGGSLKKEIFKNEGYLVYEQYHAINNDFSFGRYYIDQEKYEKMARFKVRSGDIIISCSGTMGKVAVIPKNHPEGIINQALLKLRTKNKINNKYIKCILESNNIQKKYFQSSTGSSIKNVASVKVLKKIKIPLPSLEEQKKIVEKIEEEEKIIESNKELIQIYEEKIKTTIDSVWNGN